MTPPSIYVLSKSACTLNMSIGLRTTTSLCSVSTSALLNSGVTGMFVNQAFAQKHKLETCPLPNPVPVDPSQRRLRSYSGMANTWRKRTSQSPTSDGVDDVGRIATHILKCSNFANLYLKNMNKTGTSGWTSEGRGFMLSSNKTNYSGHLCEESAIYSKIIHSELMEI